MERISTKRLPKHLKKLTRKRTFVLHSMPTGSHVTLHSTSWSGGTKQTYSIQSLEGDSLPMLGHDVYPEGHPSFAAGKYHILQGQRVVISTGTFCGKPDSLHLYIHESDVSRFLKSEG